MKILYYHCERNTPMYRWQHDHIMDELRPYDIQIDTLNPLLCASMDEANENLIARLQSEPYDLFMTCHNERRLYIPTLQRIRELGIPTLLICFDNLLIPYEHTNICEYFDLVWLTSRENTEIFQKHGASTIFLPYAANPRFFTPRETEETPKVAFIGTPYGSRANTINQLLDARIPVTLFGKAAAASGGGHVIANGFLHTVKENLRFPVGRKLLLAAAKQRLTAQSVLQKDAPTLELGGFVENLADVYSGYALSLSSTTARNTGILKHPVPVVNLRSFEIPMCGGIQFCLYNEELAGYFEDEKEILFYRSREEMVDKAKFYLAPERAALRKEMRLAARRRAEAQHTWHHRFSAAFEALGLKI
jgi:hypothetical protein